MLSFFFVSFDFSVAVYTRKVPKSVRHCTRQEKTFVGNPREDRHGFDVALNLVIFRQRILNRLKSLSLQSTGRHSGGDY